MSDETLPLFDVDVPVIRTPAPSVANPSSENAADTLHQRTRSAQHRAILLALAGAGHPLSRGELAERTAIRENVICARVDDLKDYLTFLPHDRRSLHKRGLMVEGITLNERGRRRVRERAA